MELLILPHDSHALCSVSVGIARSASLHCFELESAKSGIDRFAKAVYSGVGGSKTESALLQGGSGSSFHTDKENYAAKADIIKSK